MVLLQKLFNQLMKRAKRPIINITTNSIHISKPKILMSHSESDRHTAAFESTCNILTVMTSFDLISADLILSEPSEL